MSLVAVVVIFRMGAFAAHNSPFLNRQTQNMRISADLAYQRDMETDGNGIGLGGGIGYRYQKSRFLFDVGLNIHYVYGRDKYSTRIDSVPGMFDEEGHEYTGLHVYSNRKQVTRRLSMQLPLLVGLDFKKVYFLVGPKVNIGVWGNAREKGTYGYWGDDGLLINPFSMDGHGFIGGQPYETTPKSFGLTFDVRAYFEVGVKVMEKKIKNHPTFVKSKGYLSFFGEYAVFHTSAYVPLEMGVKFTVLLESKFEGPCHCRRR